MPVSTNKAGNLGGNEQVNNYQVQSQINNAPAFRNVSSAVNSIKNGDFSMTVGSERISLWLGAANGTRHQIQLPRSLSNYQYIAYQDGTTAPTTAEFPNDGDWGWYKDETTQYIYFVLNHNGAILKQRIETLTGSITSSQHGNLSAVASTMHAFSQLTGSITASQHGDLSSTTSNMHSFVQLTGNITESQHGDLSSSTATMHSFGSILGSLTDDKHGALGYQTSGGSNLHSLATTGHAGFMSVTYATMLENASTTDTADTLCLRNVNGDGTFRRVRCTGTIGGTAQQVLADRQAAITNANVVTPSAANCAGVINNILTAMRNHGLIDT